MERLKFGIVVTLYMWTLVQNSFSKFWNLKGCKANNGLKLRCDASTTKSYNWVPVEIFEMTSWLRMIWILHHQLLLTSHLSVFQLCVKMYYFFLIKITLTPLNDDFVTLKEKKRWKIYRRLLVSLTQVFCSSFDNYIPITSLNGYIITKNI